MVMLNRVRIAKYGSCDMRKCMDWSSVGFDWNRARAFLIAAEEGSYSAAARALGLAQPTLGRQVSGLQSELGVTLFERVGNQLELTEAGMQLLEHVRAMGEAAASVSLTAAGQASAIEGTVRVAASQAVAAYLLAPIVGRLRGEYPALQIEIVVSNQISDLRRREADIAIRHARPKDPELIATKIRDRSAAWMYATPEYIDKIGNPRSIDAFCGAAPTIFGFDDRPLMRDMLRAQGFALEVGAFSLRSDDHLVQWELAKRGLGICIMMEEVGDQEPAVSRVLGDLDPPASFPTWLTTHRELRTSRRINTVFDSIRDAFVA